MRRIWLRGLVCGVAVCVSAAAALAAHESPARVAAPETGASVKEAPPSYLRVNEEENGRIVSLQTAVREFRESGKPEGEARTVYLVAAVHIGDPGFYRALQESLDTKDVVFYEGVRPPGAGRLEHEGEAGAQLTDEEKTGITRKRMRLLAIGLEVAKGKAGGYPQSLEALDEQTGEKLGRFLQDCAEDGWGNAIEYSVETREGKKRYRLVSSGPDGREGTKDDIDFADEPPIRPDEIPAASEADEGIQKQFARALGLVFQLDEMKHTGANWRNSDLSMDQIEARISGSGGDATQLFGMLSGESFSAQIAGLLFRIIGSSRELSAIVKMVIIDMMGQADRLLAGGGAAFGGGPAGERMAKAMEVILQDRNAVVMEDLRGVLADEPEKKQIAIIYGGGHMPDLDASVRAMGFEPVREVWFTAIRCDTRDTGMSPKEVRSMRTQIRQTLERTIRQQERMREQKERKKKAA